MSKDFLSIKETAELLGLSERSIHKLIRTSDIPFAKLLSKWVIKRDDLDRWWKGYVKQVRKDLSNLGG